MFKNIKLYDQWLIIFKRNIDDEKRNILAALEINSLEDLFQKFKNQYLNNQNDIDSFELVKLLQCLGENEDNLLRIFQTLQKQGIISINHIKFAKKKDYEELGLGQIQQQFIEQEIIDFTIQNSEFYQMIDVLTNDNTQHFQIQSQLLSIGVSSIESLFLLTMDQIDSIGMNKFKFLTQKDLFNLKEKQNNMSQINKTQSSLVYNPQQKSQIVNNKVQPSSIIINQIKIVDNKQQIQRQEQIHNNVQVVIKETEIQELIRQSIKIGQQNDFTLFQYPLYERKQLQDVEAYKSMIVIGQTGSGKTTLLNFFLNYYLDIKFTDNFRFILIDEKQGTSQAVGQTQSVNIYYVKPFNGKCGIRLIDTPGFGDSRIKQDEIIGNQIKKCFKEDVESLSAICFLVQSSNARLTPNQNYILSCILAMFGNDIIQNFIFMLTFCDAEKPQALEALQFKGLGKLPCSPVANMIEQIKLPWFLKLNSSAFISPNRNEVITQYFWEIAMTSFGDFYHKKLMKNTSQSLMLTKEVIREREEIITIIQNIRPKLEQQLNQIENIKIFHQQIQCLDSRIVDSSNYKIKSKEYVIEKEMLKSGEYVTNCVICNVTCHFPCGIPEDKDKASCSAMKDDYCQQCDGKCIWSVHKNMTFRFTSTQQEVDTELIELKKLYLDSKSTKTQKEQILDGLEDKYVQQQIDCMEMQQKLMISVNRLKQIALQPGCCQFQEDYVEIMISEEMCSKREGYFNRITELQEIKCNWIFIREISTNLGGIQITKKFIETHIPKKKIKESLVQRAVQWLIQ